MTQAQLPTHYYCNAFIIATADAIISIYNTSLDHGRSRSAWYLDITRQSSRLVTLVGRIKAPNTKSLKYRLVMIIVRAAIMKKLLSMWICLRANITKRSVYIHWNFCLDVFCYDWMLYCLDKCDEFIYFIGYSQ